MFATGKATLALREVEGCFAWLQGHLLKRRDEDPTRAAVALPYSVDEAREVGVVEQYRFELRFADPVLSGRAGAPLTEAVACDLD